MINQAISQQGRARILIHEGYKFRGQKKSVDAIIAHCIIGTERNIQQLFKHIYEHVEITEITKFATLRAICSFINKYNLKKYYTKKIDNYRSNSDLNYMKIIRHYYNYEHIPNDIIIMEYSHFAERSKNGGKLISDSLFTSLATAIHDVINKGHDYQIGRVLMSYLERANRYYFDVNHDRAFTIKKDGMMRFTPKKTQLYQTDSQWATYKRSDIKYGKAIRKIFTPILPILEDRHIEILSNNLKSKYVFNYKFEIVTGEDIRFYYHKDRQSDKAASLSASCMRHDGCQEYLDIYADNTDDIDMLIAVDDDGIVQGRALIWKHILPHDKNNYPDEIKVMDRIYGKDVTIQAFKKYATDNNMWHKHQQNYSDAALVSPVGQTITGYKTRPLNNSAKYFPYLDTLKYTNDDPDYDKCIVLNSLDGEVIFDCTDGCHTDEEYVTDADGDRIPQDDACYDEYEDTYYHNDDARWCEPDNTYCHYESAIEVNDQFYHPNSELIVWSAYHGTYLESTEAYYSEIEDSYIKADEQVECEINGFIHMDNSKVIEIDEQEYNVHSSVTEAELREALGL